MALQELVLIVFYVIILVYSIIIHEVAHGYAALALGDPTAKLSDRLNLNPLKHIDPWGSIWVPLIMLFITSFRFAFGWAKPVPYNPYNLRNQKWGPAIVAISGPGSNIVIATIAAFAAKLINVSATLKISIINNIKAANWSDIGPLVSGSLGSILFTLLMMVIFWNILLAFFNLIPIPPLDGSKLLFTIFPMKTETMVFLEQFGFVMLLILIFVFGGVLGIFLNAMMNIFLSLAI